MEDLAEKKLAKLREIANINGKPENFAGKLCIKIK